MIANRGLAGIDGTISTRDRRRAGAARQHARVRADGRRDLPARRQRARHRPRRARARPDDRGRQRRRRLDLHDARAGRPGVRRPLRASSSAPRTASTSPPSAPRPARRTGGSSRCPSSSRRWPARTAASRSSRSSYDATTGASSTPGSGPCDPDRLDHPGDRGGHVGGRDQLVQVPTRQRGHRPAAGAREGDLVGVRVAEGQVGAGATCPPGRYVEPGREVRQGKSRLSRLDSRAGLLVGKQVAQVVPPLRPGGQQPVLLGQPGQEVEERRRRQGSGRGGPR